MRYLFIVLNFVSLCTLANLQSVPTKHFDLIHTDLNVTPIWKSHQLKGEATLTLVPYAIQQAIIVLDAKSFDIHKIEAIKKGGNVKLNYEYNKTKLTIHLDKTYTKKDTLRLLIDYTANPDSVSFKDGVAIKEEKGLYFINTNGKRKGVPTQLWTQGETQANSCWFPTIDHPSEKQSQTIRVTYEDKYVSLANGKLISSTKNSNGTKTDVWKQKMPHSTYLTELTIGDFKIVKDKWRDKEVSYYMEPQYEAMARPIFGRTPEMIEFFSKTLGVDYPWEKYSQVIVHDFVSGAMENTGAVTFNDFVQKDSRELVDDNDDETIAHELFHHWFGDLVTCESWTHLTLNESFANYSEYLWHDYKYGKDEAENHWYRDLQPYFSMSAKKHEPLIRYDFAKPDDMFDVISYNKGGKILHQLRMYLGDEIFFKSIKHYLTKFAYKNAEYHDWRMALEEVSGEDLHWYFAQWYEKGGHPILKIDHSRDSLNTRHQIIISQKHNFDSNYVYKMPLDFDIYTKDGKKRTRYMITKAVDTFVIEGKDIKAVVVDATNSLVGIKNETKTTEDWVYIMKHSESLLDQANALRKLKTSKSKAIVKDAIYDLMSSQKNRIVGNACRYVEKSWMGLDDKWSKKLIEVANTNKKGSTRAAAIERLGESKDLKQFQEFVNVKLKDSSYIVEDEALKLLNKIDSTKALEYALSHSNSNSFQLLTTVFDIIGKTKDEKHIPLYEEAIAQAKGFKKVAVYMQYGKLLAISNPKLLDEKLVQYDKMIQSSDEVDKFCAKSVLGTIKTELAKKEDAENKARVVKIDESLKKEKSEENED